MKRIKKEDISQSQLRAQRWVKNLLELQQSSGDSLEFFESDTKSET